MREATLDRQQVVPEVDVHIRGRRKSSRVRLIFDSGSALTQLDIAVIEHLGYCARDAECLMTVRGAVGEPVQGYLLRIEHLRLFGLVFVDVPALCDDFESFPEIDGLLGFDLIRIMHLELDGPRGKLKIFS